MKTVLETLTIAAEHFEKAGVDSPRLTAELLLAHALGCRRIDLYLRFDQPIGSDERDRFGEYYKRRLGREPLQYLIGTTNFCGLEIDVNPDVLIPRPETEELVELLIALVRDVAAERSLSILDIGTGSGCIALALASALPTAAVEGIDVSAGAVNTAAVNADKLGIFNCIFRLANIFDDDALRGTYDVIVSNPPYISAEELALTEAEVRDYEPRLATTDNADGLTFYRRIAAIAPAHLQRGGLLALEVGAGQAHAVTNILHEHGWQCQVFKDHAGVERMIVAQQVQS